MSKETGGTAFPYSGVHKGKAENIIVDSQGMTLRDYFAAQLMPAIIGTLKRPVTCEHIPGDFDYYAICAYQMADAMLRAREAS